LQHVTYGLSYIIMKYQGTNLYTYLLLHPLIKKSSSAK